SSSGLQFSTAFLNSFNGSSLERSRILSMAWLKIRCDTAFLPSHIMEFTNFSASCELYTGSGRISRVPGLRLRGILFLRLLYLAAPFGRLAPYLERPCLRSVTPAVSSV